MIPAIIFARGGSKRIPRKNVKDFCGKPLLAWTLIQAKLATSNVWLSTDDDEIAEIGIEYGVPTIRRPVMPDDTPGDLPFNMAVSWLQKHGYEFDEVISALTTCPCRLPDDIPNAIKLYYEWALQYETHLMSFIKVPVCSFYDKPGEPYMYTIHSKDARKRGHMHIHNGFINIQPVSVLKKMEFTKETHIAKNWKDTWRMEMKLEKMFPRIVGYEMKPWQYTNIGTQEEWEINELIFKKFILDKGYYQ